MSVSKENNETLKRVELMMRKPAPRLRSIHISQNHISSISAGLPPNVGIHHSSNDLMLTPGKIPNIVTLGKRFCLAGNRY